MRRFPLVLLVVVALCLSAASADAKKGGGGPPSATVTVNCNTGQKIRNALNNPAAELTIEVTGLCNEQVIIERDNVTLIGTDPATDGIVGPVPANPFNYGRAMVHVVNSRTVRFENLSISASENRGLEANGALTVVEVVNCHIFDNGFRGLQVNDGVATAENTVIENNDSVDVVTFGGGVIDCSNCTVSDDDGIVALAVRGGVLSFESSSLSTGGSIAVIPNEGAYVYGQATDVSASLVALYASENSQLNWTGGQVDGSIWADWTSQVFLDGITQATNPLGNAASENSHFRITGGSFVGDTRLTGFSNGTAEGSPVFDVLSCDRGGDLYCDGSETKSSSTCGLCP